MNLEREGRSPVLEDKVSRLRAILRGLHGGALVAFSGGTDSSLLAFEAHGALGKGALAVTADSPTIPRDELAAACAFARAHGIAHEVVKTLEMDNSDFLANDSYRCLHCKTELFGKMRELAAARGFKHLLFGAIGDDEGDWRPGMKAAFELGGKAPLMEAGFTKADVREISRQLGLETWDKPQSACLSSRFPTGVHITLKDLARVERAEKFLRELGFRQNRVRLLGEAARIEVEVPDLPRLVGGKTRRAILDELKNLGFRFVTLDIEGFRSGSLSPKGQEDPDGIRRNP